MDCTAKQDLLIWQKQYLHRQGLLATKFSTNYFLLKYFIQKLYPKFNFGDFHSLLYLFKSKNIFGHDSWFFIVTSVKTNARKEATRIGEKIYFYMWFWLWYLPPIFSVYMSSSSKCYPNMTRLGNITSTEDCLMVCIINHENHILTFNFLRCAL